MRFGLLGTGWWATDTHGPGLVAAPDVELVAVWGRDPDKAATLADRLGTQALSDVDDLFDRVDAVAIALPPDVQADLAVRAAEAGRHLLLDKPLALDVRSADRVVAAVETSEVASVVFFTNRFDPGVAASLDDAVQAGGWRVGRATFYSSVLLPGNERIESPWRDDHGGLWDVGPHTLASLLPVLGPAEAVTALQDDAGTTQVLVRHQGGAVSSMAVSLLMPRGADERETTFGGDAGWRSMPDRSETSSQLYVRAAKALVETAGAGRTDHPCGVQFGRDVVAILEAVETSIRTGQTQRMR